MPNELNSLLKRLGFTEDEAQVLLTIYRHPALPAGRIAEHAGFKRGHTYNLLSSLVSQGVVQEIVERGVKRFTAIAPVQLMERIEQQRLELIKLSNDLGGAVGKIEALIPSLKSIPRVQVFRGASGVKELFQLTLTSKEKVIRAYGDFSATFPKKRSQELNKWLWDYAARRAKKGILYKGIVTKSAESDIAFKKRKAHKREMRLLKGAPLSVEINIFDRYVAIASTSEEMMGVLIESEPIAQSTKRLFEALWLELNDYQI